MAIDIDQSHYSTGLASVAGTAVTGTGTTFTVLRKGDLYGTHRGSGVRIASIEDDTHLTLAYDVPALYQTDAPFEVQRVPYDIGYLAAIEELIRTYGIGMLPALAALDGTDGDKIVALTGPASADAISAKLLLAINELDGTGGDKLIKLAGPNTAESFDGKRIIALAATLGAGVAEYDASGNVTLVPKADLISGVATPQGRLTLTSGVAVTTTDVVGATSIHYVSGVTGLCVPIFDGSKMAVFQLPAGLSVPLDSNAAHAGYHRGGGQFDLFIFNDAGTLRLGTGPEWLSDTARGTGPGSTEIKITEGVWTNANSIALRFGSASGDIATIPAGSATCVGSFRATSNGLAEDSVLRRLLSNIYNQVERPMRLSGNGAGHNYSLPAWRQFGADITQQLAFLNSVPGGLAEARSLEGASSDQVAAQSFISGVGLDQTGNVDYAQAALGFASTTMSVPSHSIYQGYPGVGRHYFARLQRYNGAGTGSWQNFAAHGLLAKVFA